MKKIWSICILAAALCIGGCGSPVSSYDSSVSGRESSAVEADRSSDVSFIEIQSSSVTEEGKAAETDGGVPASEESVTVPSVPESIVEHQSESLSQAEKPEKPLFSEINHYVINPVVNSYLSEEGKAVYPALIDGILNRQEEIRLTDDYDTNLALVLAARYTPYYFLVEDDTFTRDHKSVRLTYAYNAEEQREKAAYIDQEYLDILNSCITPEMNDVEKTLAVYCYFASRISYDYAWLDELNMAEDKYLFPDIEVYDALKTNKGVCHSYTYLCEFALEQLGIECIRVDGVMRDDPDTGHMWLMVKLDGKYYHCDPTWDSHGDGTCGLEYFGMTDEERDASGVDMGSVMVDSAYGDVTADSMRFDDLHDITSFTMNAEHRMTVQRYGQTEVVYTNEL